MDEKTYTFEEITADKLPSGVVGIPSKQFFEILDQIISNSIPPEEKH